MIWNIILCWPVVLLARQGSATPQNHTIVSIPNEYTYLLPAPFEGNLFHSFVNSTNTSDPSINALFHSAKTAPFISFDEEFLGMLGPEPVAELIEERQANFAGEAGVWLKERNEVWFTTWINDGPTQVEILDLADKTVRSLNSSRPLQNPNGGVYHDGLVYFSCLRDDSRKWPGGVVSVNPETGEVKSVLNSYFGLKFDNVDDLAWVTQPETNHSYLFITILPFADGATTTNRLPQGVWRWDPQTEILAPAISRTDIPVANGIRPSKDQKTLWVTDFGGEERSRVWGLPAQVGSPAIYRFDLDNDMWPVNKRIFGASRMQAPDGIRVDDEGRVWTGEGEGVVVRNPHGKVIGIFNSQFFTRDPVNVAIVQFCLAGDTLVILGENKLWTVKLTETIASK
ncbi:hypothetical protein ARSEF1564_008440 [Beauveria bassiana]